MTAKCPACGAVMRYAESANVRYCPNCGPMDAPIEVFEDLRDEADYIDYSPEEWYDDERNPALWNRAGNNEGMIE